MHFHNKLFVSFIELDVFLLKTDFYILKPEVFFIINSLFLL